jgi:hypothetical protein
MSRRIEKLFCAKGAAKHAHDQTLIFAIHFINYQLASPGQAVDEFKKPFPEFLNHLGERDSVARRCIPYAHA